jgi:FKBP-type peptidyl-prolyl cis-trans isomerase SlyD
MQITTNSVVAIHFVLSDTAGEVLDSSEEHGPLAYIHGQGQMIPGLEAALEGKSQGESFKVTIEPEEAYGVFNEELIQTLSRDDFQGVDKLEVGMQFEAQDPDGDDGVVTIASLDGDEVTVDGNHPLAGETLNFEIEINEVRAATAEELEHGHVHGPGGHQH